MVWVLNLALVANFVRRSDEMESVSVHNIQQEMGRCDVKCLVIIAVPNFVVRSEIPAYDRRRSPATEDS